LVANISYILAIVTPSSCHLIAQIKDRALGWNIKKAEHGLSEDEEKENEEYKEDYPGKDFLKIYSLMK
jgi:hypothetical protein